MTQEELIREFEKVKQQEEEAKQRLKELKEEIINSWIDKAEWTSYKIKIVTSRKTKLRPDVDKEELLKKFPKLKEEVIDVAKLKTYPEAHSYLYEESSQSIRTTKKKEDDLPI